MKRLAVIRVRGMARTSRDTEETLKMLRLTRVNYCALVNDSNSYAGMLQKVKDYVTWGEVDAEDVEMILRNRGELIGGARLTDAYMKEKTKYSSIKEFAKAFVDGRAELKDIPELKLFFRLHPPRKGYSGIKRSFKEGGALGARGAEIKKLIYRMR